MLAEGQNELQVPMTYTDAAGNTFTKTFVLKRGDYAVKRQLQRAERWRKPLEIADYGRLEAIHQFAAAS